MSIIKKKIAIELKYKTKALIQNVNNEEYVLNQQGAHDTGRYDVLKDFQRVEHMIENGVVDKGYVIFLTNDPSYYQPPNSYRNTVDKDFRIHFGQKVNGELSWADNTGEGTKRKRKSY
ncbi:hypothetical protein [Piscibacillus salipiscarius]|uniref:hypothetical protein n=1 Tax=Piscibacillus salipiscarius TaxID=299480 RepID=UPI0006D26AE0|nr:hypothetical protein [Piscibacillus salipiscarius]